MKTNFKTGELVQLKSGGPVMTVSGVVGTELGSLSPLKGHIKCQWFSGKKLESGVFPPESLQEPEEEK